MAHLPLPQVATPALKANGTPTTPVNVALLHFLIPLAASVLGGIIFLISPGLIAHGLGGINWGNVLITAGLSLLIALLSAGATYLRARQANPLIQQSSDILTHFIEQQATAYNPQVGRDLMQIAMTIEQSVATMPAPMPPAGGSDAPVPAVFPSAPSALVSRSVVSPSFVAAGESSPAVPSPPQQQGAPLFSAERDAPPIVQAPVAQPDEQQVTTAPPVSLSPLASSSGSDAPPVTVLPPDATPEQVRVMRDMVTAISPTVAAIKRRGTGKLPAVSSDPPASTETS